MLDNECCQCGGRGAVWNKYSPSNPETSAPDPIIWRCVGCNRYVCVNCILTVPNSKPVEIMAPALCSEVCHETWRAKAKLDGTLCYYEDD